LPRLVKVAGATAAELTALNLDKTPLLEELIVSRYGGQDDAILGELQFAFVAFVFGQSLDGEGLGLHALVFAGLFLQAG
jgi:A1 cistron-splicing factor AAR2